MDEYDEDVDPLAGPIADLMAEHSLSSTTPMSTLKTQNPTDFLHVPPTKTKLFDLLVHLNLRSHFRQVFTYLLDKLWYHYLHKTYPKTDQDIILNHPSPTKLISLLVVSEPVLLFSIDCIDFSFRSRFFLFSYFLLSSACSLYFSSLSTFSFHSTSITFGSIAYEPRASFFTRFKLNSNG